MSETVPPQDSTMDDEVPPVSPTDEMNVLGIVVTILLVGYAAVGLLVLLVGAYGFLNGWTLYGARPYWAALTWPVGGIGLLTPGLMELDAVTEVDRTPPVLPKTIAGYGVPTVALVIAWAFGADPVAIAGLVATVTFSVLSLLYVRQRDVTSGR